MVLLLVSPSFVDSDYDWTKAERELRAKLDDWKGLLQRQVPQARQILKKLLAGPIRFTPVRDGGERYYTFTAPIALDRVIAGTVGAAMMASPTGRTKACP